MAVDLNIHEGNAFETVVLVLPDVYFLANCSNEISQYRINGSDRPFLFTIVNNLNSTGNEQCRDVRSIDAYFEFMFRQWLI